MRPPRSISSSAGTGRSRSPSSGAGASVEDVILAKLEWAAETDSERQIRDVAGMVAVSGDALDAAYLTAWAERLGLEAALLRVIGEI